MFPHGQTSQYSIYSLCFSRLLSGPRLQSRAFHVLPKTGRNTSAEAVPVLSGRMKLCSAATILHPVQSILQGLSGRRILRIHTEQTELRTWNYLMPFEIRNELCSTVAVTVSFAVDYLVGSECHLQVRKCGAYYVPTRCIWNKNSSRCSFLLLEEIRRHFSSARYFILFYFLKA